MQNWREFYKIQKFIFRLNWLIITPQYEFLHFIFDTRFRF